MPKEARARVLKKLLKKLDCSQKNDIFIMYHVVIHV